MYPNVSYIIFHIFISTLNGTCVVST